MDDGQFYDLNVCSIQRNRSACRVLRAGQAATLALGEFDRSLLRKVCMCVCVHGLICIDGMCFGALYIYCFLLQGMVMVSPEMHPTVCWMFEAEIVLLFHAKTFHKGFQVTVHVGNVRQTATVEALQGKVRPQLCSCRHTRLNT